MRRTHGYLSLLLVSATLSVSGCGAWSSGAEPVPSAPHELNEGSLSALSGEQSAAASELTNELGEDPRFGSVALNAATGGLVLYWHGDPPDQVLASVRDSHPEVPVEVRGVELLPGDLRAAARAILETESDAGVGATYVRPDGTGITVQVHLDQVTEDLNEMAARLSSQVGFPVDVEGGAPVPAEG